MRIRLREWWPVIVFTVGVLGVAGVALWIHAHFEAKSYNHITGAHVSTWDAFWVDLRVLGEPR